MALTKITANVIEAGAISTASLADTSITAAKLAATLDLTGKAITVATASAGDNDTTVASTAFVTTAIANLTDSAPAALDTLNELAAALNDDANFSTTVTNSIALKAPLASPTFTGDATFDTNTLFVDGSSNVVGIRTTSPYTVGGTAGLTIAGSSVLLSMGNSNTDLAYFRRMGSGIFQWQTYSVNANAGELQLQPYGGNVGIGTSSPDALLDISSATTSTLRLSNSDTALTENQITGQLEFYQADTSSQGTGISGKIGMRSVAQKPAGGNYYGNVADMDFYVSGQTNGFASDNASLKAMTIQAASGSVGIGTASPTTPLHVYHATTDTVANFQSGDNSVAVNFTALDNSMQIATSSTDGIIKNNGAGSFRLFNNGSERLRIDSSGNVGIGVTSPTYKIDATTTSGGNGLKIARGSDSFFQQFQSTTGGVQLAASGSGAFMAFRTGTTAGTTTERMRINSSGNLGLGVTPSAWSQGRAMEVFQSGFGIWNGTSSIYSIANAYFDSGFKYANTGVQASHYYQFQGAHVWSTAPSGTAGNTISFTQAMTLDASGNVGIGTSSPTQKLDVNGTVELNNLTVAGAQGSDGQLLTSTGSGIAWEDAPAGGPTFKTFGTGSIMIGDDATGTINAADNNTGLGVDVFEDLTSGDSNVAIGRSALKNLTTGSENVAVGIEALFTQTTATGNTAVGRVALRVNTGNNNTAVGTVSLYSNTTGGSNTAVGAYALQSNTTASNNAAFGYGALLANTTGSFSTAVGHSALTAQTGAGAENTAVGHASLISTTEGVGNTAVGEGSGRDNTTGGNNVAIGADALRQNTTASENVAVGSNAGRNGTTSTGNTDVGYRAGYSTTTGYQNTRLGIDAGYGNTTAYNNVHIGINSGYGNTTGAENVTIGLLAGRYMGTTNYNTFLGSRAGYATTSSENVMIGGYGGSSNTSSYHHVIIGYNAQSNHASSSNTENVIGHGVTGIGSGYNTLGGNANRTYNQQGSASWSGTSDERLKTDVVNEPLGLSFINDLRPVKFKWKKKKDVDSSTFPSIYEEGSEERVQPTEHGVDKHGFLAQELESTIANYADAGDAGHEIFKQTTDGVYTASPSALIPMLVKALQEADDKIDALTTRIAALEG